MAQITAAARTASAIEPLVMSKRLSFLVHASKLLVLSLANILVELQAPARDGRFQGIRSSLQGPHSTIQEAAAPPRPIGKTAAGV